MTTTSDAGRSSWQLIRDPRFGSFILGKTLAFIGVWIHNVVAAVIAWEITHSATWVAIVSVVQFLPQILLAPVVGPMADRSSRGRQVAYGRVFCVAGSGGLAIWLWITGVGDIGIWPVLLMTFTVGVGFAISGPAMQAMVPDLVEPVEVGRAVGLDSVPTMLGRAAGPAIGALLLAFAGAATALGVAMIGHLVFGVIGVLLARDEVPREISPDGGGFVDGLRYIRRHPVVILLLLGVTGVGMGADPVVTLAPALAHDLGGSDALVGYFGSAFGIGAVLGSVISAAVGGGSRPTMAPVAGLLVMGAGLAVIPLMPTPWGVCLAFLVSGVGFTVALAGCTTSLHRVVPTSMRGRVMSLWVIAFMGTRPVAAIVNGVLADGFGTGVALVTMGLFVAGTGALCLPRVLQHASRP